MKFEELDIVKVITDTNKNIYKGAIGTIISVFNNPSEAYEVEIVNNKGETICQATFSVDELEKIEY